jgi:hypothetical protein
MSTKSWTVDVDRVTPEEPVRWSVADGDGNKVTLTVADVAYLLGHMADRLDLVVWDGDRDETAMIDNAHISDGRIVLNIYTRG